MKELLRKGHLEVITMVELISNPVVRNTKKDAIATVMRLVIGV